MKIPKARKQPSGMWFTRLRLGGQSIPITARTEKECNRQATLIKAEYLSGKRQPPPTAAQVLTLGEAIDNFIRDRSAVLSPSTRRGYKTIRKNHFQELVGKKIAAIKPEEYQAAINAEAKKFSAHTVKNAWGLVASVVADVTGGRAPSVDLPRLARNERPFLEPEQIIPFVQAVHGSNVEIPALLALSSLRRSEIMALRWEAIDTEKGIIRVQGAAVYDENNKLVQKKENKNASSARIVPIMIPELLAALQAAKQDSGLVVTCNPNTIWSRVNKICEKNGLPKVGVHGLRHSFVSLGYHLGAPEKDVMEIGGWSDYQTMRKIYTHVARSDIKKYTDKYTSFYSSAG